MNIDDKRKQIINETATCDVTSTCCWINNTPNRDVAIISPFTLYHTTCSVTILSYCIDQSGSCIYSMLIIRPFKTYTAACSHFVRLT